ncbi:MAG: HXXEE domain-containing protein [Bacteroidota bacterium]
MKNIHLLTGSTILLFAMLWLPLGQYDFLLEHWMKVGTYAVPFLFIGAFSLHRDGKLADLLKDARFIGMLMLIAYIIHQYEEHWIDIRGNVYAFYTFNNGFILGMLNAPEGSAGPLTRESILVINTVLVWLVGVIAIIRSPKHLFPLSAMAHIIIVNGFVHILGSLVASDYNPGLLTSIVVFIPIYLWFLRFMRTYFPEHRQLILWGFIWALLAHVLMVAGLLQANWFHNIPEMAYFAMLIVWSLLPVVLWRPKGS